MEDSGTHELLGTAFPSWGKLAQRRSGLPGQLGLHQQLGRPLVLSDATSPVAGASKASVPAVVAQTRRKSSLDKSLPCKSPKHR